jgi:bisphosphoglycerate-independent phosphoglycerate mutase (AlkP superfamily)
MKINEKKLEQVILIISKNIEYHESVPEPSTLEQGKLSSLRYVYDLLLNCVEQDTTEATGTIQRVLDVVEAQNKILMNIVEPTHKCKYYSCNNE